MPSSSSAPRSRKINAHKSFYAFKKFGCRVYDPAVKEQLAYPEDPFQPRNYLWSDVQSRLCPRPQRRLLKVHC